MTALAPLVIPYVVLTFGTWKIAFLSTLAIGLLWMLLWMKSYSPPASHPQVSASDLAFINSDERAIIAFSTTLLDAEIERELNRFFYVAVISHIKRGENEGEIELRIRGDGTIRKRWQGKKKGNQMVRASGSLGSADHTGTRIFVPPNSYRNHEFPQGKQAYIDASRTSSRNVGRLSKRDRPAMRLRPSPSPP